MPASNENGNDLRGVYHAVVVDNADPLLLGRVRFRIPGLIEPASAWAFPGGGLMGGVKARGSFSVPKREADIVAVFVGGDADVPVYFSGHYGLEERPDYLADVAPADAHHITILEDDRWEVVMDCRPGGRARLRLRDKLTDDEILMEKGGINIRATTLVHVESDGGVVIAGNAITIGGRPVLQNGKPIA